jgi:hypothetical protein
MFKQFISFIKSIFGTEKETNTWSDVTIIKEDDTKEVFWEKCDPWIPVGEVGMEETPTKVEEPVEVKRDETPVQKPKRKYNHRKKGNTTLKNTVSSEEKPKRKYTRRSAPKK